MPLKVTWVTFCNWNEVTDRAVYNELASRVFETPGVLRDGVRTRDWRKTQM